MRWSGLSIKDAVTLERPRLDDNGALSCVVPRPGAGLCSAAARSSLIAPCPTLHQPAYFFLSGNLDARSAVQGYERSFRKLLQIADLKDPDGTRKRCRPHMFRDAFAVELLLALFPSLPHQNTLPIWK